MTVLDEALNVLEPLLVTMMVIAASSPDDKQRIADAYEEACALVATIALDQGDEPGHARIVACFRRFSNCEVAGDVASAGWMLVAIQERVAEPDLCGCGPLREIVEAAVQDLPLPRRPRLLH